MTSQRDETVGRPSADDEMADKEMADDRMADDPIIVERHDEILTEDEMGDDPIIVERHDEILTGDDPADGTLGDSTLEDGAAPDRMAGHSTAADSTIDGAAAGSTLDDAAAGSTLDGAAVEGPDSSGTSGFVKGMRVCSVSYKAFNSKFGVFVDNEQSYNTDEPAIDLTASSFLALSWLETSGQ